MEFHLQAESFVIVAFRLEAELHALSGPSSVRNDQ